MTTQTLDYLTAVNYLPADGILILPHISWHEFELLAVQLGDRRDIRLSYDRGKMEITMPSPEHEEYVDLIQDLTRLLVREMGLRLESRGTALLKRELRETGAQPDGCFYIQHAAAIIGKRQLDLAIDPPPDIVVEVDLSTDSRGKFSIYTTLGVPELWRYDGLSFEMYHLTETGYVKSPTSLALPFLTAAVLTDFLERSKVLGQDATLDEFSNWVQRHKP
jgi:Uma2 family endonuclease